MHDALIIGAGPAGATAARMLAQAGWSVALVEKSAFPRRKVCGEFISATSLPLLYDRDVRERFLAEAGPEVRRVGLFAQDAVLSAAMPAAGKSVSGWGRALGRDRLDQLLAEAAAKAGADLRQPCKVVGLKRNGDGFVCSMDADGTPSELQAKILIAANGSWERAPWTAEHPRPTRKPSELLAFKARFDRAALSSELMPLLVFPGGYGGMVHTDGGTVSLSCCIRRDALELCRQKYHRPHAGEAVLAHIMTTSEGVKRALGQASLDGTWLSAGPIRPGIRPRYADGIFFIGNSAGEAHPIIAEGISMAMQSAWLLSKRLITGQGHKGAPKAVAELGRLYARDWHMAFATRIHAAALFAHLAMWPGAGRVLPIIKRVPEILTWGAWLSGKTTQLVP
jgi:flavin-dependent dehydrogenase